MKHFLSCDWGTSSLRLRLADTIDGKIAAETRSGNGIAQTFERWRRSGLPEDEKAGFYLDVIGQQVEELEKQTGQSLSGLKLVLSGMASSSIGFIDLPYASMPFGLDGADLITAFIASNNGFEHDVLVISGAKTDDDVMRGEETQLVGCIAPGQPVKNELFIFPGTHSKHVVVRDNHAVGLKTYMTGEVFSLLTQASILKNTVQHDDFDPGAFGQGLADSASGNLLNLIFKVRTNGLFDRCSNNENYNYLSGLLVGSELNDLVSTNADNINLVCSNDLRTPYAIALNKIVSNKKVRIFSAAEADAATVTGQLTIAKHLNTL